MKNIITWKEVAIKAMKEGIHYLFQKWNSLPENDKALDKLEANASDHCHRIAQLEYYCDHKDELQQEKTKATERKETMADIQLQKEKAKLAEQQARVREAEAKAECAEIARDKAKGIMDASAENVVEQQNLPIEKGWIEHARETYKIPKVLPPLLKPFVDACPEDFKIPMLAHMIAAIGALCCSKVRAKDSSGRVQSPTLGVIIEASSGAGKSMFQQAYEALFKEVLTMDAAKINSGTDTNPHITQILNANISQSAMVNLLKGNHEIHTYCYSPEISEMTNMAKTNGKALTYEYYRKNFDNDYYDISTSRQNGRYRLYTNMTFTGTPYAVSRFVGPKQVEDGTASRFMYFALPSRVEGENRSLKLPEDEVLESLRENAKILCHNYCFLTGDDNEIPSEDNVLPLSYMNDAIRKWRDSQQNKSLKEGNTARMGFVDRYGTMAFRCAMVLHVLFHHFGLTDTEADTQKHISEIALLIAECALDRYLDRFKNELDKIRQSEEEKGLRPTLTTTTNDGPKLTYDLAVEAQKRYIPGEFGLRKVAEWLMTEKGIKVSHTKIQNVFDDLKEGKTW